MMSSHPKQNTMLSSNSLSAEQQAIVNAVAQCTHNVMVIAVAGAGKTTLLKQIATSLAPSHRVLLAAYNRHIAAHLKATLPPATAQKVDILTTYSLGARCLNHGYKVNNYKYDQIIRSYIEDHISLDNPDDEQFWANNVTEIKDAIIFALNHLLDPSNYQQYLEVKSLIDLPQKIQNNFLDIYKYAQSLGMALYHSQNEIDFVDMLWIPIQTGLYKKVRPYDVILIDEAQDLSVAQLKLLLNVLKKDGRVIAVGDPKQSIYLFSGTMPDSMAKIYELIQPQVFFMKKTFRCPLAITQLARTLNPIIETHKTSTIGQFIIETDMATVCQKYLTKTQKPSLIICPQNWPLLQCACQLIKMQVPFVLHDQDFFKKIKKILELTKPFPWSQELHALKAEIYILEKHKQHKENGSQRRVFEDQMICLETLFKNFKFQDWNHCVNTIEKLFSSNENCLIRLSTIHRAKGLEAPQVILLYPELAETQQVSDMYKIQNSNLLYVAITRSSESLIIVTKQSIAHRIPTGFAAWNIHHPTHQTTLADILSP